MKLLVTGASGFVGSHVVRAATQPGAQVRGLVRRGSDLSLLRNLRIEMAVGDVTERDALRDAVTGVDAVVHCAATTSETRPDLATSRRTNVLGTQNLVAVCLECGVRRFVLVSTQSATEHTTSVYGMTKLEAERVLAASTLRYTILRPSTVYGFGARGLFAKMSRYVARLPVIPIIGNGRQRFRPIYVGDVATAIFACLESEEVVGKTYDLGGLDGVSFEEFIDGIGDLLGKKPLKIHVPVTLCVGLARALAWMIKDPPLTVDNIVGLTRMNECDISSAQQAFGFRPISFRKGLNLLQDDHGVPAVARLRHC